EHLDAEPFGLLWPRLHVRLINLHDVGAGGEQVFDLHVNSGRIVHGERNLVLVVVILRLLAHGEGAWHGDLDRLGSMTAQELDIAHLHRVHAPDWPYHPRHGIGMTTAVERSAGVVDVDTLERSSKAVGVTLAAHLAVGDDIEPSALLVADGENSCIILRL